MPLWHWRPLSGSTWHDFFLKGVNWKNPESFDKASSMRRGLWGGAFALICEGLLFFHAMHYQCVKSHSSVKMKRAQFNVRGLAFSSWGGSLREYTIPMPQPPWLHSRNTIWDSQWHIHVTYVKMRKGMAETHTEYVQHELSPLKYRKWRATPMCRICFWQEAAFKTCYACASLFFFFTHIEKYCLT